LTKRVRILVNTKKECVSKKKRTCILLFGDKVTEELYNNHPREILQTTKIDYLRAECDK